MTHEPSSSHTGQARTLGKLVHQGQKGARTAGQWVSSVRAKHPAGAQKCCWVVGAEPAEDPEKGWVKWLERKDLIGDLTWVSLGKLIV